MHALRQSVKKLHISITYILFGALSYYKSYFVSSVSLALSKASSLERVPLSCNSKSLD